MTSYISSDVLCYDCSDISDISDYLTNESSIKVSLDGLFFEHTIVIEPYDPLKIALEKLRRYFGVKEIGYHIVNIDKSDTKYLLRRYVKDTKIKSLCSKSNDKDFIAELRKCFCFQWLVGMEPFNMSGITVKNFYGYEYPVVELSKISNGKNLNYDTKFISNVNRWFGKMDDFNFTVQEMINCKNLSKILKDVSAVLEPYVDNHSASRLWANQIIDKLFKVELDVMDIYLRGLS
jgi:hypothetical protein